MTTSEARYEAALAQQIKVELAERGMDQKDLAEAIGIHKVTMSQYMTGKLSMKMPTFYKVSEALGLTPAELMTRSVARTQPES